jgi:hypothetical protein
LLDRNHLEWGMPARERLARLAAVTPRSFLARASAAALTAAALTAGALVSSTAAQADTPNDFEAALTATATSVTVDLGATQYPSSPTALYLDALRNGCDAATPCWAESDASQNVDGGFTGAFTLSGLKPATVYEIRVLAYTADGQKHFAGFVTTGPAVNDAPSAYPVPTVSADGIHASVAVGAEYDQWNIHDGGTIAGLRYNVYAYVDGRRFKQVLSNVAAGTTATVSGLPLNKRITFTETDTNSIGESPESTPSGAITLAPKAPGAFSGRSYTGKTVTEIVWTKPAAGTGRITKFVVRLDRASHKVFSHTYSAKVRDAEIKHLRRHTHYVVYVTAYNDHGKHTTIRGVLTTK